MPYVPRNCLERIGRPDWRKFYGKCATLSDKTISRILWPDPGLHGCVFCVIARDTLGSTLGHFERFNFFPASPLACVTWQLDGECRWIGQAKDMEHPSRAPQMPVIAFSGAQVGSLVSWNPGPTRAVTIAFYPDVFSAITGIDLALFTDRMADAEAVLPNAMMDMCETFLVRARSTEFEAALTALQREMSAQWVKSRRATPLSDGRLESWSQDLVRRANVASVGQSKRQIARRVKSWTGINARELHNLGRVENLYESIHKALQAGDPIWANIAAEAGYADQAHMIRRLRQHTGFTPGQLRARAATDEAFWPYRLLEQYFDRPEMAEEV